MNEPEGNDGSEQVYVACFVCDKAIESKEGFFSAINIFDKFEIDVPEGMEIPEPFNTNTVQCISIFRSRVVPIAFTVTWRITGPNGKSISSGPQPVRIVEGTSGHTSTFPVTLPGAQVGVYWIEVLVDGRTAAFTPLSIAHVPVKPSSFDKAGSKAEQQRGQI